MAKIRSSTPTNFKNPKNENPPWLNIVLFNLLLRSLAVGEDMSERVPSKDQKYPLFVGKKNWGKKTKTSLHSPAPQSSTFLFFVVRFGLCLSVNSDKLFFPCGLNTTPWEGEFFSHKTVIF